MKKETIQDNLKKIKELKDDFEKNLKKYPKRGKKDDLLKPIEELFEGKIGDKYDIDRLKTIEELGEWRYSRKIPPGYEDEEKGPGRKFGDLVIWNQIIDHAKEISKPIILVIDDRKEDWWWIENNKIIGPRFELKKEIFEDAKVNFQMYMPDRFLKHAAERLEIKVEEETIEEVKSISESGSNLFGSKRGNISLSEFFPQSQSESSINSWSSSTPHSYMPSTLRSSKQLYDSNGNPVATLETSRRHSAIGTGKSIPLPDKEEVVYLYDSLGRKVKLKKETKSPWKTTYGNLDLSKSYDFIHTKDLKKGKEDDD